MADAGYELGIGYLQGDAVVQEFRRCGAVTSGSSGVALPAFYAPARFNASVNGLQIQISNAAVGSNFAVFSMQGKVIQTGMIKNGSQLVTVKNKGAYVIRVGNEVRSVIVK